LRRDRALVVALVLVILSASLGYTATVVAGARALRTRNALERNQATARLCARLLDEQCASALAVLRTIARQPVIEARLRRRDRAQLRQDLQDAVELVPDLRLAALYDPNGRLLLGYPAGISLPAAVGGAVWFRRVKASAGRPVISEVVTVPGGGGGGAGEVLTMAVPVAARHGDDLADDRPAGYLLAYYRLGDIYSWLRQFHLSGSTVQIVGGDGDVIASSGGPPGVGERLPASASLDHARRGGYGGRLEAASAVSLDPRDGGKGDEAEVVVVGYARAERTGWVLLVSQPTESAYAPSDFLLRRLSLLTLPLVALLGGTAWLLVGLYHRQERLADTLAERNERLRQADRAKSDLLANVSHDLKTPIASMQLSVSGLLDVSTSEVTTEVTTPGRTEVASQERAQVQECLALVSRELDELAARVRNLLDMTRLEAGGPPPVREPCDLSDIVASALERLRFLLHGRAVDARFPPEPLLVECDQNQMETVVMNLLENAHKYSPPGTPLHLWGEADGNTVVLRVRDEGPGIAPAERERVFEKFYRSVTRHAAGGTGLGLAICRSVVETHGGRITVVGAGGGDTGAVGAEFVVTLPRIADEGADLNMPQPGARPGERPGSVPDAAGSGATA
jgi:signal transduction histidine kinase